MSLLGLHVLLCSIANYGDTVQVNYVRNRTPLSNEMHSLHQPTGTTLFPLACNILVHGVLPLPPLCCGMHPKRAH